MIYIIYRKRRYKMAKKTELKEVETPVRLPDFKRKSWCNFK